MLDTNKTIQKERGNSGVKYIQMHLRVQSLPQGIILAVSYMFTEYSEFNLSLGCTLIAFLFQQQ
jgi:hypothetical protein